VPRHPAAERAGSAHGAQANRRRGREDAAAAPTVSVPPLCPAPAVLLNPAPSTAQSDVLGVYIGFNGAAELPLPLVGVSSPG
jgi:hypothetical protein